MTISVQDLFDFDFVQPGRIQIRYIFVTSRQEVEFIQAGLYGSVGHGRYEYNACSDSAHSRFCIKKA